MLGSTSGLSAVPVAALLCGVALVVGLAVLLVVVITVRRRRQAPPPLDQAKQKSSLLEINDGDRRYVVSYTLKSPADCRPEHHEKQPDILSAPRGKCIKPLCMPFSDTSFELEYSGVQTPLDSQQDLEFGTDHGAVNL